MKIGDQIVVDDRVFILRGVEPMSMDARRVYLEDARHNRPRRGRERTARRPEKASPLIERALEASASAPYATGE